MNKSEETREQIYTVTDAMKKQFRYESRMGPKEETKWEKFNREEWKQIKDTCQKVFGGKPPTLQEVAKARELAKLLEGTPVEMKMSKQIYVPIFIGIYRQLTEINPNDLL